MSPLRVTIVGPFAPYRGGIAMHTTRLKQALESKCDVHAEAYRNPFPKWLYPGDYPGDLKGHPDCLPGVHYELSYVWPGAWPGVTGRILQAKPDVVLIPWWTFFFAPHYARLTRKLKRAGIPVVFLCHNFFDHESSWWKRWLSLRALRHAAGFVFHSPEEQARAESCFPQIPTLLSPHPLYDHLPLAERGDDVRNDRLKLLFFGLVRPYKGLEDLIDAIESMDDCDVHLTIAGEWWSGQEPLKRRCRDLEAAGRVRLIDHYVSDAQAAAAFQDCDAVVLPYRKATNSGVLAHALQARKPVIVTRTGALPKMVQDGESGLIVAPHSPRDLRRAIDRLGQMIRSGHDFTPSIEAQCRELGWDLFADRLTLFLSECRKP